eukprot:PITA_32796
MEEEYNSHLKNQTWDMVPLPSGRKLIRCKWVYRTKSVADGQITRQKARLVAKGFQQVHGIDYGETFAPVAKMDSTRLALAIAAAQGWTHYSLLILVLYVDDLLITSSSVSTIAAVKRALHDRFFMTDMGPLHFFLGLEISQDATGIKLSQAKYARDLLERFHMTDCKPT